jgi:GDPmannose 4,6-dehydratase
VTQTALICGVTGQDGSLLARLLLSKGYTVYGTSRETTLGANNNLVRLGIAEDVKLLLLNQAEFRSVLSVLEASSPDEVYFLSGQSSVGASFAEPAETVISMTVGPLNLFEAIRLTRRPVRTFLAASSEMFGPLPDGARASETTPLNPRSPYGIAKASAHWLAGSYRENHGQHNCSGILFNHESALRPPRFVTQKIITAAKAIKSGARDKLVLGNLAIVRDWGWADEFVDAMWRTLQADRPDDYVIATGQSFALEDFVALTFEHLGLDWRDHVESNPAFYRPSDIARSAADVTKAADILGWRASIAVPGVVERMLAGHL